MKPSNKDDKIYIVVECFNHDKNHRVVVVRATGDIPNYLFLFVGPTPNIDFGDTFLVNLPKEEFFVCRGNIKLTFKITPLTFPGTLLLELLSERMNL